MKEQILTIDGANIAIKKTKSGIEIRNKGNDVKMALSVSAMSCNRIIIKPIRIEDE